MPRLDKQFERLAGERKGTEHAPRARALADVLYVELSHSTPAFSFAITCGAMFDAHVADEREESPSANSRLKEEH